MRKIYLTLAILLAFGWVSAQNVEPTYTGKVGGKTESDIQLNTKAAKQLLEGRTNTNKAGTNGRWYNYGFAVDDFLQGIGQFSFNNVFPDTTILVDYGTSGFAGPWIHKIGDVLDVTSEMFNDITNNAGELELKATSAYKIDSVEIWGVYFRGTSASTAVDTLRVDIALKDRPGQFSYFGPTSAVSINLGVDTCMMVPVAYTQASNTFGVTPFITFKIPLTAASENDTLENGLNYVKFLANFNVPANKLAVLSYDFIPGYTWTPNLDTITKFNRWRFISLDENPGQFPIYTKRDWNLSLIVPQDVRYNDAGGWNGRYIPSFAYMGGASNTYSYVHHCINYLCSGVSDYGYVGMEDNAVADNLGNAYPNPVSQGAQLYVTSTLNNTDLIVTDIVGKEVLRVKANQFVDGKAVINTSNLTPGIYFYSMNKVAKKFVVVK